MLVEYAELLRRRRRIVVPTLVVLPLAAVLFSLARTPVYEGTAEVLLGAANPGAAVVGLQDAGPGAQSDRAAATQADLARVPDLARRTLAAAHVSNRTAREFLRDSSVSPKPNADLLEFKVRNGNRTVASQLATEYARQYTIARRELDTAALNEARRAVQAQIDALDVAGTASASVRANLLATAQRLATIEALQASNATLVRPADYAEQVEPRPERAFLLGLGLALVLAVGLAFAWDALDTRVRSVPEVWQRLGLPLLAVIPAAAEEKPRPRMLVEPRGPTAEVFRVLRANVDLANLDRSARLLMVTGAAEEDGRSTVAANLAIALARAGRHVILVDLDVRHPTLAAMFGLRATPGLVDAMATSRSARPLVEVQLGRASGNGRSPSRDGGAAAKGRNGGAAANGRLEVLVAGRADARQAELVGTSALGKLLDGLRDRADLVVLKAPSLLADGDAIALGGVVDAIVAVVRLSEVRRGTLAELKRALDSSPAAKLGVVVTGVEADTTSDRLVPSIGRTVRRPADAARGSARAAAASISRLRRPVR